MKFYRLSLMSDAQGHAGFQWFTNEKEAKAHLAHWRRNDPGDTSDGLEHQGTIEPIEIAPTRKGILAALNRYADHADNG